MFLTVVTLSLAYGVNPKETCSWSMEKLFQESEKIARNRENRQINLETNIKSLGGIQEQFCFRVAFPILPSMV